MTRTSIAAVVKEIRTLGLSCTYRPEYSEFRIDFPRTSHRHTPDSYYCTQDRMDALHTAQIMSPLQPVYAPQGGAL